MKAGHCLNESLKPSVHGESGEHEWEEAEAQDESPSFPTEPGKAHLMNARGIWNPKAKLAVSYSWD